MANAQETDRARRILEYLKWQVFENGPAPDIVTLPPPYEAFAKCVPLGLRNYVMGFKAERIADHVERRSAIPYAPPALSDEDARALLALWRQQELAAAIGGSRGGGGPKRR